MSELDALDALDELLRKTSRTFALSIPLLPEPTRREVTIAYLLFRIADTFEDASHWSAASRIQALSDFSGLLREPSPEAIRRLSAGWVAAGPSPHAGYVELVAETPFVLEAFFALSDAAIGPIRDFVVDSAAGMARFVARTSEQGELRLHDLSELRDYCYMVAGLVGEMLTELFVVGAPKLLPIAPYLRERARLFGEGLQLVNILKDSEADAKEGRGYLPARVDKAEVFALARRDLAAAAEYILALQRAGAPRGFVAFTALPVELAWAALDRVERHGPGSKISRLRVFRINQRLNRALDRNLPAVRVPVGAEVEAGTASSG